MLVQATEIKYDYTNNTVAAVGNVQIYYNGATIEADEVTYDQKTKRLRAQGNVRLTEADGKITYGQLIDLTDDYRDGFVDSLRLETTDDTRFAAQRADRTQGNYTVLQNGVYTACEPCKNDPKKPPLWQVQAARIIHDQTEKMLYFEDARVEFFGVPLAWVPFMSAPDPTVKRKSGFLFPTVSDTTQYGFGVEVPYYWALAPNYDVTVSTMATTRQGELFQGEWRHRLMDGAYSIKAAGIFQQDPGYFASRDGVNSPTANFIPRRRSDFRSVRARQQLGLGLDRHPGHRFPVLERLPAQPIHAILRPIPYRHRLRRRFPALPDRHRRPQLFRYTFDLLLRLFATGRAKPASGHPSGARLF